MKVGGGLFIGGRPSHSHHHESMLLIQPSSKRHTEVGNSVKAKVMQSVGDGSRRADIRCSGRGSGEIDMNRAVSILANMVVVILEGEWLSINDGRTSSRGDNGSTNTDTALAGDEG